MSIVIKKCEQKCCVPDCKTKVTENTIFHKFPNDKSRKADWIRSCNITSNVTNTMLICGSHFGKNDYQSVANSGLRHLKPTAIPKVNPFDNFEEYIMIDSKNQTSQSYGRRKCSVPQCNAVPDGKRSYHFLPKQDNLKQKWLRACGIRLIAHPYACVCSDHFLRSDFITGPTSRKQILKVNAVPSLNLPNLAIVKREPKKVFNTVGSNIDDQSEHEEKVTTIIYVPDNHSNKIISTTRTDFNNSDILIDKQEDLCADDENLFYEVESIAPIHCSKNNIKTENKISPTKKVTAVRNTKSLPNNKKPEVKRINQNAKNVQGKITDQKDSINKLHVNKSKRNSDEQISIDIDSSPIKRTVIRPGVSAVTLCADCGQYCKIEDEDLLYKSYKNSETLAGELLLELQEGTVANEDEQILLTKKGIELCNKAIQKQSIDLMDLLTNDNELMAFTGINFELLTKLTKLVSDVEGITSTTYSLPARKRIVICLCKLRINLSFACLGMLFGMTQQVCASNFFSMLKTLSVLLEKTIHWPKTEELLKNLPECFQSFKQTRVILHCSEAQVEKQRCSNCQQKSVQSKIKRQTMKFVLGIAPSGLIIFRSNVFESQSADVSVFKQTNIMDKLNPLREAIMADKTLNIENECAENNVTLIKLPKLGNKKQFSKQEVELIKNISSARIHVDRSMHRFKMYKIMQTKVHWRILPYLDEVCTVIAGIVNLKNPIAPKEIDVKSIGLIRK